MNEALDQDNERGAKVVARVRPDEAVRRPGVQAREEPLRPAHLHARSTRARSARATSSSTRATGRRSRSAASSACTPTRWKTSTTAGAGDIVALFGVECASGDTFTDGTRQLHDDVDARARRRSSRSRSRRRTQAGQANLSKALNRFTKEDPTFRVHRDEESARRSSRGMGELHLEIYVERMSASTTCEVHRRQAAGRVPRDHHAQAREFNYTHKKQTGGSGQFAQGRRLHRAAAGRRRRAATSSSTTSPAARSRASSSRRARRASSEAVHEGPAHRLPGRRRARASSTTARPTPSTRPNMAFKTAALDGLPRGLRARPKPTILEPIMKVEVEAPEEFQGPVIGPAQPAPRHHPRHRERARAT